MRLKRSALIAAAMALCVVSSCTARGPGGDPAKPIRGQEYGTLERLNITTSPTIDTLTFRGLFHTRTTSNRGIEVLLRITVGEQTTRRCW